jgi:DNA-binding CsgD family transcriptional regulator
MRAEVNDDPSDAAPSASDNPGACGDLGSLHAVHIELIAAIYDAVGDASCWGSFLEAFGRATRSKQATLLIGGKQLESPAMVVRYGWTPQDDEAFASKYIHTDGWLLRGVSLGEGEVIASHELWPEQEMVASTYYREFLQPRDWHFGMGCTYLRTPFGVSVISMLRSKKEGPCLEPEITLLKALVPHLRRAALLHGELTSLRTERAALVGHLERYPQAFVLVDEVARVLFANATAKQIATWGEGIEIVNGTLRTTSEREESRIRKAVMQCAQHPKDGSVCLEIQRGARRTPFRLLLMPIANVTVMHVAMPQPAVAILILDPESQVAPDPALLRELFSLTPAEARVTSMLAKGLRIEEVASQTNVSFATVRTHLRSALSKTATHSQGSLISLVLRTVPFHRL